MTGGKPERRQALRSICKDFAFDQVPLDGLLEEIRSLYPKPDDTAPEIVQLAWHRDKAAYETAGGDQAVERLAVALAYED